MTRDEALRAVIGDEAVEVLQATGAIIEHVTMPAPKRPPECPHCATQELTVMATVPVRLHADGSWDVDACDLTGEELCLCGQEGCIGYETHFTMDAADKAAAVEPLPQVVVL